MVMKHLRSFFEYTFFGVCTKLGAKMGIPTIQIRKFFIYSSFITFGSPIIAYLGLAFIMNMRQYLRRKKQLWYY